MKTIFIIDGTSGIWKADLVNYLSACKVKSKLFIKFTTREPRPEESVTDLTFLKKEAFAACNFDCKYIYDGHEYGFNKKEVEKYLTEVDNLFIVIRNLDLIQDFKKSFPYCKIVTAFIFTDFHVVSKRVPYAKDLQHKKCILDTFRDYLRHPYIYDEIIINGGTVDDFNHLIDLLLDKFTVPENESGIQKTKDEINPSTLTIGDIINNLKLSQLWCVLGALVALLAGAFALGRIF